MLVGYTLACYLRHGRALQRLLSLRDPTAPDIGVVRTFVDRDSGTRGVVNSVAMGSALCPRRSRLLQTEHGLRHRPHPIGDCRSCCDPISVMNRSTQNWLHASEELGESEMAKCSGGLGRYRRGSPPAAPRLRQARRRPSSRNPLSAANGRVYLRSLIWQESLVVYNWAARPRSQP